MTRTQDQGFYLIARVGVQTFEGGVLMFSRASNVSVNYRRADFGMAFVHGLKNRTSKIGRVPSWPALSFYSVSG